MRKLWKEKDNTSLMMWELYLHMLFFFNERRWLILVDVALLPPFTQLGHMAQIFKPLGVSLGASLESRMSPCSWLLRLGQPLIEAKGGRPYEVAKAIKA